MYRMTVDRWISLGVVGESGDRGDFGVETKGKTRRVGGEVHVLDVVRYQLNKWSIFDR
jgi:hypothetical protein